MSSLFTHNDNRECFLSTPESRTQQDLYCILVCDTQKPNYYRLVLLMLSSWDQKYSVVLEMGVFIYTYICFGLEPKSKHKIHSCLTHKAQGSFIKYF